MKTALTLTCVALVSLLCLIHLTACKSSDTMTPATTMTACPMCKGQLQTTPAKDVPVGKCQCTQCGKVAGPYTPVELRVFLGIDSMDTVQYCPHCKMSFGKCAECCKKSDAK